MRIATWNVNSLRSRIDRVEALLDRHEIDVLALQETKAREDQLPLMGLQALGYEIAVAGVNQWNGVALVSRVGLEDVQVGFDGMPGYGEPVATESRAIGAVCGGVRIWSLYVPNGRKPDDPHYRPWRDAIEQHLAGFGDDTLLVGHSFGGSVLLKYLAEGTYERPIAAIFLVSVPFWRPDFRDFALPEDFAAHLPSAPTFLYHSRDDPEVPASHLLRYQEHLPDATTRIIEGSQHSFTDGLPDLVRDIRATAA